MVFSSGLPKLAKKKQCGWGGVVLKVEETRESAPICKKKKKNKDAHAPRGSVPKHLHRD